METTDEVNEKKIDKKKVSVESRDAGLKTVQAFLTFYRFFRKFPQRISALL